MMQLASYYLFVAALCIALHIYFSGGGGEGDQ